MDENCLLSRGILGVGLVCLTLPLKKIFLPPNYFSMGMQITHLPKPAM